MIKICWSWLNLGEAWWLPFFSVSLKQLKAVTNSHSESKKNWLKNSIHNLIFSVNNDKRVKLIYKLCLGSKLSTNLKSLKNYWYELLKLLIGILKPIGKK